MLEEVFSGGTPPFFGGTMTKHELLKTYFGYDAFRPGQEAVIDALLSGRDALNVMPTGGGKSICYQVPALLLPGVTLVISPLVSLMRDQVTQLVQMGIPAAFLNSTLSRRQYQLAMERAMDGWYKIIYVAPERLDTPAFLELTRRVTISLVAVDEAHCISQWGQDFRPAYLNIPVFVDSLPQRPAVGAFTATATAAVREDIDALLHLRDPLRQVTGFDRENLYFEVRTPESKKPALLRAVEEHRNECGIVYCATRKAVEEVCEFLQHQRISATRYHAGLEPEERQHNQEDFLYDRAQVMVATNAFGMGIDKSDVRFVVHYNMPKDLESYYQEAGRAGRDGAPASCILLYNGQDVRMGQFLITHAERSEELDAETAARLQERDLERLKQMTYYCRSRGCLRQFILRYFGEQAPDNCGNCYNCLHNFEETDVSAEVREILRCVGDTREHFGMTLLSEILHGADSERVEKYHLEEEPTYGTLSFLSVHEIRERIHYLIDEDALYLTDGQYPVVKLGARAEEMAGRPARMKALIPAEKPVSRRAAALPLDDRQQALYQRLRELRVSIARMQGVPPFVVFSDKTLREMAAAEPLTPRALLEISGVGAQKSARYGTAFLDAIAAFRRETDGE
jgi:ATP-dependent DNA helicase RecQ